MEPVRIRYQGRRWSSDAQLLRRAEVDFLTALASVFGSTSWHVSQAIEAPGMQAAAALLAEARGWNRPTPTHIGRVLTDLARRGAPLVREPRGGVIFWRLTGPVPAMVPQLPEPEPVAAAVSCEATPAPVRAPRRPSARRSQHP